MIKQTMEPKTIQKGGEDNEKQSITKTRAKSKPKTNGNSFKNSPSTNDTNGQVDVKKNGVESSKMDTSQEIDIAPYVTNPEGNIYGITNLPEEFIAVLFAWVSRSPKSFKEQLRIALQEGHIAPQDGKNAFEFLTNKAKAFHEKWTVNYGHSCYDEETDVLTRQGFKRWADVTMNDELASVNPETLEIEFQKPVRLINEPYNGPMYKVDRNRIDMLVTPNHKIFAWPRHLIEEHVTRKYQLIDAINLKGKCYKVKLGGLKWNGDIIDSYKGYEIEPLLKFYGLFIGDGYIDERMKHAVQFHFYKQRKINYLFEICNELGLSVSANKNNKFYVTSPNHETSIGELMAACYDQQKEKQIPEFLFDLDAILLENLYDGLLNSDGSVGRTGEVYDTSSLKLAQQMQYLCVLLGWTSSLSLMHPSENPNHKNGWRVFINKKLLESMVNKLQYDIFDEWVDYNGNVYCAELEKYHTLIVRRNGRIHVSGNSVAEHAVAHVGIEKVSRLASAELELSNEFYSITEYSQRYQKPERGNWYNPFDVLHPSWEQYNYFMHECFDVFETLINGVFKHLCEKEGIFPENDKIQEVSVIRRREALRKLAFEDARYALPLAMYTQLGMSANGRAWRDGIVNLYNSNYSEVHKLADDLKTEISKILPTLLKHATPSEYKSRSKTRVKHHFARKSSASGSGVTAKLTHFPNEEEAITNIVALLFVKLQGLSFDEGLARAKHMTWDRRSEIIQDMIFEMGKFDNPPEEFKFVDYQAELLVSEANWHQLLRHNRKTNFIFNEPSPYHGITIPPRVKEAELDYLLIELAEKSKALFEMLDESVAAYVVLNAHRRRIIAHFDLWEAYHLINLRTSDEAQWDIKETFNELYHQLSFIHPRLIQYAKRR